MVTGIVLAAGRSSRMGGQENKQFLTLANRPVLSYSLAAFEACPAVDAVVLVRRADCAQEAERLVRDQGFTKVMAFADGGLERQNSVWNGLALCDKSTEIVAVHDGARPLVTPELIQRTVEAARQHGTGIAARKVVDTIKEAGDDLRVLRTVDRLRLWAVQTPQTVRFKLLKAAYQEVFDQGLVVTDEAMAVERLQQPVQLVDTPFWNVKLTTPDDLVVAEALLRQRQG